LTTLGGGATVRLVDAVTAVALVVVGVLALLGLLAAIGLIEEAGSAGLRRLRRRSTDESPDLDFDGDDAVAVAQANAEALDVEGAWFMMTPEALVLEPLFDQAVAALADDETPVADVIDLSRHPDGWAASMALAALERRDDVPDDWPRSPPEPVLGGETGAAVAVAVAVGATCAATVKVTVPRRSQARWRRRRDKPHR